MGLFEKVSVEKSANVYFDGKVTSRTVIFEDGEKKTLGIMLPGEYKFGTGKKEYMEITSGKLDVKLPGCDKWVAVNHGEAFEVPANSSFELIVKEVTDYCCSYITE
jgi:uncharacterized protein YaiE (UPF0345 family)